MGIQDLQTRLTTVGRIRLGISPKANQSKNPGKLTTFRLTSPSKHLIWAAAEQYGGTPRPWTPQGGGSPQFEVITETDRIAVAVPRQNIDPWYESYGGGFLQHRCDGQIDRLRNQPCVCDPDERACKVTTRITMGLRDVPGLGVWLLESHGWNAAAELTGLTGLLQMLPDRVRLPGHLVMDPRQTKRIGKHPKTGEYVPLTQQYIVPVIQFDAITMRALDAGTSAITGALELEAGPAVSELDQKREELLQAIRQAPDTAQLNRLGRAAKQLDISDQELIDTWRARAAQLNAPVSSPPASPPVDTPVDAEVVEPEVADTPAPDEDLPDPDDEYNAILSQVGKLGWNTATAEQHLAEHLGVSSGQANGHQLRQFRQHVEQLVKQQKAAGR